MSPLARTDERKRATHREPSLSATYERDFYSWCMQQALALKRAESMKLDLPLALDWENLAEEVESMGREQEDKLESAYRVLLVHLLKWQYQPEQRSSSWRGSIVEQRRRARKLIVRNPGLKPRREELYREAYDDALPQAIAETGLSPELFPKDCPYVLDLALREGFFPGE